MPDPELWTLSEPIHRYDPVPAHVLVGVPKDGGYQPVAHFAPIADTFRRENKTILQFVLSDVWHAWKENQCNTLTLEQTQAVMLARILTGKRV